MADQPVRVILRLNFGFPYRVASEEERTQTGERFNQLVKKWKSSGIKHIASITNTGGDGRDGFSHLIILEVGSLEEVNELNGDIFNSGMILERYSIDVTSHASFFEVIWDSA